MVGVSKVGGRVMSQMGTVSTVVDIRVAMSVSESWCSWRVTMSVSVTDFNSVP